MGAVVVYEGVVPVEKLTLQERVYAELRRHIMDGVLAPGEVLTIRSIATAMGTSVMPVREALQRLAVDQAVVVRPNRSISVATLSRDDFLELSAIRKQLEGLGAARAAELITDEGIEYLEHQVSLVREAIRARDVDGLLAASRAFCFHLQTSTHSTFLPSLISGLWLRLGPTRRVAYTELFKPRNQTEELARTREPLLEALRRRNPDEARMAMEADVDAATPVVLRFGQFKVADGVPDKIAG